eukprot:gene6025-6726_t
MATDNSVLDLFVKYGLFIGAIFQLACIFAILILPSEKMSELERETTGDTCDFFVDDNKHHNGLEKMQMKSKIAASRQKDKGRKRR